MKPDVKVVPVRSTQPIQSSKVSSSTRSVQLPEVLKTTQPVQPPGVLPSIQPLHMKNIPEEKRERTFPANTSKKVSHNMKKKWNSILNHIKEEEDDDDEYEGEEEDDDERPPRRRNRIVGTSISCPIEEDTE